MSDPHNSDRDAIDSIEPSWRRALDRTFGAHFGTSTQILPDEPGRARGHAPGGALRAPVAPDGFQPYIPRSGDIRPGARARPGARF